MPARASTWCARSVRPGRERRGRLREDALEAEHEREAPAEVGARVIEAAVDLAQGGVQRASPRRSGRERAVGILARMQQRLTAPRGDHSGSRLEVVVCGFRLCRNRGIAHGAGAPC